MLVGGIGIFRMNTLSSFMYTYLYGLFIVVKNIFENVFEGFYNIDFDQSGFFNS